MDAEMIISRARNIGSAVLDGIRGNLLPAALTGGGIGWFAVSAILRTREKDADPQKTVRDMVAAVQEGGGKMAAEIQEKARETGDGAREKIAEWRRAAQEKLSPLGKQLRTMPENRTLVFGAVALGVGFLLGMIIAKIQGEDE